MPYLSCARAIWTAAMIRIASPRATLGRPDTTQLFPEGSVSRTVGMRLVQCHHLRRILVYHAVVAT